METVLDKHLYVELNGLVEYYYQLTRKYTLKDICSLINNHHNIDVTVRKLKYIIKKLGFKRQKLGQNALVEAVANEVNTSRCLVGYRKMTEIISLKYECHVAKEKVRLVLIQVDLLILQTRILQK